MMAMDLEGVLIPEIWIALAQKTGIEKLKLTTRDISDYDVLMKGRLEILDQHGLTLNDIQDVIGTLDPLPGAGDFLNWLRTQTQVVILSDTFYEFAMPLMKKLGYPTLFCHSLETDEKKRIVNYHLRITDGKKKAVKSFKELNYRVIAAGDSYNDTTMLGEADHGILFKPPQRVIDDFPQYPVFHEYADFKNHISGILASQ
ncbi:MAG TPA: bifunctional phosphoserine phosphatase/homoserine phosphotransferase ThrH [Spirochaetia bacterium]|nr:MAG: phosphoserine phosphatase [Spirochaetes bacterium GWB1_36_13]HCL57972.1 bifunctional phosphoserine phosphatase/homoserine phosphotransferase ThrH [Spirochaetia bacterium]